VSPLNPGPAVTTTTKLTWELFKLPEPFETIGMNPRMGAETIHNFKLTGHHMF
jgi:hypothetical protein